MANIEIKIDVTEAIKVVRSCMADELAKLVRNSDMALAVVLRVMRDDDLVRLLIAEEMFVDHEAANRADKNDPDFETHEELTYDDIVTKSISTLLDVP